MKNSLIHALVEECGQLLRQQKCQCVVAESCTGGSLAAAITDSIGSSRWFERGFVTYSNLSKQQMLGVSEQTLQQHGAVSEETVREMAEGALKASAGDVSASISGIAGPDGGSADKPVGTVWIAWARNQYPTIAQRYWFDGDRANVRQHSIEAALRGMIAMLKD